MLRGSRKWANGRLGEKDGVGVKNKIDRLCGAGCFPHEMTSRSRAVMVKRCLCSIMLKVMLKFAVLELRYCSSICSSIT